VSPILKTTVCVCLSLPSWSLSSWSHAQRTQSHTAGFLCYIKPFPPIRWVYICTHTHIRVNSTVFQTQRANPQDVKCTCAYCTYRYIYIPRDSNRVNHVLLLRRRTLSSATADMTTPSRYVFSIYIHKHTHTYTKTHVHA